MGGYEYGYGWREKGREVRRGVHKNGEARAQLAGNAEMRGGEAHGFGR